MKDKVSISDELLNAYIDNELDAKECELILEQKLNNPELAQRIAELNRLKSMVQHARPGAPAQNLKPDCLKPRRRYHYVAMVAMLFVGVMVSFLAMHPWTQEATNHFITSDTASIIKAHTNQKMIKLVVHINRKDNASAERVLKKIESLLIESRNLEKSALVEVVANGMGLELFRTDQSPLWHRISTLIAKYDNLIFAACKETMQVPGNGSWADIQQLPGVMVVGSGRVEIARRKSQGWSYISI